MMENHHRFKSSATHSCRALTESISRSFSNQILLIDQVVQQGVDGKA